MSVINPIEDYFPVPTDTVAVQNWVKVTDGSQCYGLVLMPYWVSGLHPGYVSPATDVLLIKAVHPPMQEELVRGGYIQTYSIIISVLTFLYLKREKCFSGM